MRTTATFVASAGLLALHLLRGPAAFARQPDGDCLVLPSESEMGKALRGIRFSTESQSRPLRDIRIAGLRSISEDELWRLYGGKPKSPTAEHAAALLRHITKLGIFATVDIGVDVDGDGSIVEFRLREQPTLQRVTISGLGETSQKELLRALLEAPPTQRDHECPEVPPRRWIARVEGGDVEPGVLWKGLPGALERVVDFLFDEGHEMASLRGALTPDGTLTLHVDEGKIAAVELHGVGRDLDAGVRKRLGLAPGQVFVASDLESGLKRVREEYPFLRKEEADRWTRARPDLVLEPETAEGIRFHTEHADCDSASGSFGAARPGCRHPSSWYSIDGDRLEVYLKPIRGQSAVYFRETDLLRHTRVTGYAPGLSFETHVWDPHNLVHFALDGGLSLNTGRRSRKASESGFFESLSAKERLDWHIGPRLQLPALRIAEAGVQLHAFTDSSDYWRRAPLDVYMSSLFGTGSGVDFYRRAGLSSFVTWRVENLSAGVEYRLDRYDSLASLSGQVENPPVDVGRMGSLVFRAEWATERSETKRGAANPLRNPETRLFGGRLFGGPTAALRTGFRTMNTLETARPSLGGDARFDFTHFVSDNVAILATGEDHGLLLRLRAAGGKDLPIQKQEALGGWSALRGYDFKEFRGDYSLLAMAEYRFDWVSVFADLGSVKQGSSWLAAKLGLGVALNAGDWAQLAVAWRTDDRSEGSPKIRLIIRRSF